MGHFLRYHLITVIVVTTMLCGCKSRVAPDPESDSTSTITDDVTASQAETTPPERNQQLNPTGLLPLPKNGVQLTVGPFTVPAGQERTMCGFADINVGSDKDIVRIETAMNNGSHHMNLYFSFADLEKDGTVSCGKDTMAQMIMFGAQLEYHDVPLPNKIALPMPDGQQAILEAHFVNATTEPVEAMGVVNLHFGEPGQVEEYGGLMALFPSQILVPPKGEKVVTSRCIVPFDADLFALTSHMHRFGQKFEAFHVNPSTTPETKTLIYANDDWHKPEFRLLQQKDFIGIKEGDLLEFSCHYKNDTDKKVTGGPSAETDEMCIFGTGYVPYHGILLCNSQAVLCPADPINPSIDPKSGRCVQYFDCINRCGKLNVTCNNCCTPAMTPECMNCMQGLLGCAMQSGCGSGYAAFEMSCVLEKCGDIFAKCSES